MQRLLWYVNRLGSMTAREILWRLRSLLRDAIDLVRLPLKLYPNLTRTPYRSFRTLQPGFAWSPIDRSHWSHLRSEVQREWTTRLLTKADRILDNRLDYFDLNDRFHGNPFNWHRDHSALKDSPSKLSALLNYRDFDAVGDCKLVWEPNRHHQLVVLARAFQVTGDLRYARKIVQLLTSWMRANPFGYGMNWKSPLEVGIRVINWIFAIDLIRSADVFEQHEWSRVLETIYLSCWDIQRKYSRGSSANNHLIGEAAGVYIATSYFPEFDSSPRWRRRCKAILEREILLQTYADGCTREHAFGYQIFTTQFFTFAALTGRLIHDDFSADFLGRLRKMYGFLDEISYDTGGVPNMGDSDDGYVLDLGELPASVRRLLAAGTDLLDIDLPDADGPSETAFWLYGKADSPPPRGRVARASIAFRESGYYLLRSNPRPASGAAVSVFMDCAELGFGSLAAHGHADCLSFVLNFGDKRVLVDSGTYDYFTYTRWRNYFRSTRAHNTVVIDGRDQSESLGPFLWGRRANPRVLEWHDDADMSLVTAEHDGYARLRDPVTHRRSLRLDKHTSELTICDRLFAKAEHKAVLYFHVDPDCSVHRVGSNKVRINAGETALIMSSDHGDLEIHEATDNDMLGWNSDAYHIRRPSCCIMLDVMTNDDAQIVTRLQCE